LSFTARKVKATLHWLCEGKTVPVTVNLYGRLLKGEIGEEINWDELVDPESKIVCKDALAEESLGDAAPESKWQFIRHGYFVTDLASKPESLVFNRIVALKDTKKKGS
jgi:glutaminyl-tRNA synthetase